MIFFDVETDGLLEELTRLWCVVCRDHLGNVWAFHDYPELVPHDGMLVDGVRFLESQSELGGHNIICFDIEAIRKIYPDFKLREDVRFFDTYNRARMLWQELKHTDQHIHGFPKELRGKQTLEAWGFRMRSKTGRRVLKKDQPKDFSTFDQETLDYCICDTDVNLALGKLIRDKRLPEAAAQLEQDFAEIIDRQAYAGFAFDSAKAETVLASLLADRASAQQECADLFPLERADGDLFEGGPKVKPFNPGSRPQIARELVKRYGWEPQEFTKTGPKINDEVLSALPYPEAATLARLFTLNSRLAQLAEGKQAWMKHVREDGRIPSVANHNGAITHRCRHQIIVNVPKPDVLYGEEFRSLFIAPDGRVLVGWDASGLEGRCLAHYLSYYDGGEYIRFILSGGDMHARNLELMAPAGVKDREHAKTTYYAWAYGAMNPRLGWINGGGEKEGARIRHALESGTPGMEDLLRDVKKQAKEKKVLRLPDGRMVRAGSQRIAFNRLNQATGAVVMKLATVFFHKLLEEEGLRPYRRLMDPLEADFVQVTHQHDECQTETSPEAAQTVGGHGVRAIEAAGRTLRLRCPLSGAAKTGQTWAETH